MLTAFSIIPTFLGFFLSFFLADRLPVTEWQNILLLVFMLFLVIVSLVNAVLAQWRFPYELLADIGELFQTYRERLNSGGGYECQAHLNREWVAVLSNIHLKKRKNDDKRVKFVIISMIFYLSAIVVFSYLYT